VSEAFFWYFGICPAPKQFGCGLTVTEPSKVVHSFSTKSANKKTTQLKNCVVCVFLMVALE
jgi:hypothetical protein